MFLGHVSGLARLDGLEPAGSAPALNGTLGNVDVELLQVEVSGLFAVVVFLDHTASC